MQRQITRWQHYNHLLIVSKHFVAAAGLCLLLTTVTACQSGTVRATITATPSPSPQPAAVLDADSSDAPSAVNPLTGLPVPAATVRDRLPLAVKISNAPDSVRPQAGIGQADIVFEHYVEGNLTRFTALFWTHTPPRVGSIRSARLIDLEIPAMYGTLFAYSGAAEGIRQRIADLPFAPRAYEGVTAGEPLYFRDPGISMPHNLFAIPAQIWERADDEGLTGPPGKLAGLRFDPVPPEDAPTARQVTIDYGPDVVRWSYDPDTNRYARAVDGEPHTDANTGEQVTSSNVVLIYAHHQLDYSIVESEWQGVKSYSTEIQIWTLGPAVMFRDGHMVRGFWHRWEENSPLTLWWDEAATEPFGLAPGNTWFQVVPLDFIDVIVE